YQPDQCVEPEAPAENGHAEHVVHEPAQTFEVLINYQRIRVTCCQKYFPTFASAPNAFLSPDLGGACLAGSPSDAANSESGGAISSSPRLPVSQRLNVRPIVRLCSTGASAISAMRRSSSCAISLRFAW